MYPICKDIKTEVIFLSIIIVLQVVIISLFLYCLRPRRIHKHVSTLGQCTKDFCGALDPVTEPSYNMKNVVMQSILLEEHLAEDRKYCKQCCVKHFLHMIALCEEALMMSGMDRYPMIKESRDFYENTYNTWKDNKNDDAIRRTVVTTLREWRKTLMEMYVM